MAHISMYARIKKAEEKEKVYGNQKYFVIVSSLNSSDFFRKINSLVALGSTLNLFLSDLKLL